MILIILILMFFLYCFFLKSDNNDIGKIEINDGDKIVWAYWENKDGDTPTHIKLCFETFKKHLNEKYKVIILDQNSVKKYLPEVRNDLNDLLIAQKVDYYRIALLYKYGGIWVDADTIIMRDFDEIFDKLKTNDFVGFGCTQNICFNGKDQPSNGVLASQKNGKLMKLCLDKLDKKLNGDVDGNSSVGYYDLGKYIIWDALKELKQHGYDYYHFSSEYDGTRDINGSWLDTNRHFSEEDIKLINENKLFFVFLTNAGINEHHPWVKTAKREDLLNGKYWISKMFRKSFAKRGKIVAFGEFAARTSALRAVTASPSALRAATSSSSLRSPNCATFIFN
jgi:hypothetical protein